MLSSDSIIEDCIMLFDYCTKSCGYNLFIIDEIDGNKLRLLRKYIEENNVVMCKKYYKIISDEVDEIRNRYCYNVLPYKSSFRELARDLYKYMEETWLLYNAEYKYLGYMLKKIQHAHYYDIKKFLEKRAYSLYYLDRIPFDPNKFYCHYVPIEAILYYIIEVLKAN